MAVAPRSGRAEDVGTSGPAASGQSGWSDAVVAAASRSARLEDAVVAAAPRSGRAEDVGASGPAASGRSGLLGAVVAAASRSSKSEDAVVAAASG